MFTQEVADKVCELLAGGMSLNAAAREMGIPESNFRYWVQENPGFAAKYTRAREMGYHARADRLADLVDSATADDVAVLRLKLDHEKWSLSKMLPKVYGEKQQIEHSGEIKTMSVEDALALAESRRARTEDTAK